MPRRLTRTLAVLMFVAVGVVKVEIVDPRVNVRWADGVGQDTRIVLERRFGLESGQRTEGTTWRYVLRNRSRENIRALVDHPAVDDTHDIDRSSLTVPDREVRVTVRGWSALVRAAELGLFQLQSLILLLCGGVLMWAARLGDGRRRRHAAMAALLAAAGMAFALPLRQPIAMGDSESYTRSRDLFEDYAAVRHIRSEAHLSWVTLARLDTWYGRTNESPTQALRTLTRAATAMFFVTALGLALFDRWSPRVLRYLSLTLLAPAALLYFGYQELGYLSLNLATFPLLAHGLQSGGRTLEVSGVVSGVGAALHGFGLLSVAGAALATLGNRALLLTRTRQFVRLGACSLVASFGWIPLYLLILQLPMVPGHADTIPLRPWLDNTFAEGRVNVAIFSATGARDVLVSAWVAGAPLLGLAALLWRRHPGEVRAALLYAVPSVVFLVSFWPVQGLGVDMDLVLAAFPALYALAWVCAHDTRIATIAATILASGHLVFWHIVLSGDFVNRRIE